MHHFKIFIELTRLNKPIGFMLLFWPCAWGLAFANLINKDLNSFFYYLILFFIGSVLMRSAGCIINDIIDIDFDQKVTRTKFRPLASKKISITEAILLLIILLVISFFILLEFNFKSIVLGLLSVPFVILYPFMKRITFFPQLFLGIIFSWGVLIVSMQFNTRITFDFLLLYFVCIFWTLAYDTIYAYQDKADDILKKSFTVIDSNNAVYDDLTFDNVAVIAQGMMDHFAEVHVKLGLLYCSHCEHAFYRRRFLRTHMKNVHDLVVNDETCPICKDVLQNSVLVDRHLRDVHVRGMYRCTNEGGGFICHRSDKLFATKDGKI